MEPRDDLASNLEFWSGRARSSAAGGDSPRPRARRSFRRRSFRLPSSLRTRAPRGRARPAAAAALLAALAAGWLIAGHRAHASAEVGGPRPLAAFSPAPSSPSTTPATARSKPTTVPLSRDCSGLTADRREVRCVVDGIDLDVRLYPPGSVAAAYRRAAGAAGNAQSGPPACARGVPDERTWSVAAVPGAAVGWYRCRFEHGHAAMWWTGRDRLVHAVSPDGDLAALFSWWRTHPAE
jgi:hypothetical protein